MRGKEREKEMAEEKKRKVEEEKKVLKKIGTKREKHEERKMAIKIPKCKTGISEVHFSQIKTVVGKTKTIRKECEVGGTQEYLPLPLSL